MLKHLAALRPLSWQHELHRFDFHQAIMRRRFVTEEKEYSDKQQILFE
jgi:hypothetical protein